MPLQLPVCDRCGQPLEEVRVLTTWRLRWNLDRYEQVTDTREGGGEGVSAGRIGTKAEEISCARCGARVSSPGLAFVGTRRRD